MSKPISCKLLKSFGKRKIISKNASLEERKLIMSRKRKLNKKYKKIIDEESSSGEECSWQIPEEILKYPVTKMRKLLERMKFAKIEQKNCSYLAQREKRKIFRENVVEFIKGSKEMNDSQFLIKNPLTEKDANYLRYYFYIMYGINDIHVAPIDHDILEKVLGLVPERYIESFPEVLNTSIFEAEEDYRFYVKKSVVDYLLYEAESDIVDFSDKVSTLKENEKKIFFTLEHSVKFRKNQRKIAKNLILYHSCIQKTFNIYYRDLRKISFIDSELLSSSEQTLDLVNLSKLFSKMILNTEKTLRTNWLSKVKDTCQKAIKKGTLPVQHSISIQNFWDCIAIVMESCLAEICLKSIEDYMCFLTNSRSKNFGLKLNVLLKNKSINFEPTFKLVTDTFIAILKDLLKDFQKYPRIEKQIQKIELHGNLQPKVPEETIKNHIEKITEIVQDERIVPELLIQEFDKYISFINGEEIEKVKSFCEVNPPHAFEEFGHLLQKYYKLSRKIRMEFDRTIFTGLFVVNRDGLINHVAQVAHELETSLLNRMIKNYQEKSRMIGEEYQKIAEIALCVPQNTSELISLCAFVKKAETKTMLELEDKLREIVKNIIFLSDYAPLTPVEIKTNNFAFQWYHRMPSIFEEHGQIVKSKTEEYQEALKLKIKRFEQSLKLYEKQCNEMQYWRNVDEIFRYRKKATNLEKRLVTAINTINEFNEEEKMFQWEISKYPLRKQIADKLSPHKKLYDSACDFLLSHENWMGSMIGTYDPDLIESESRALHCTIRKLEKSFQEPAIRKLTESVITSIDEFQEHMPLIATLGNPHLKARHWEQVSEIVGFPIKVDHNMTLEKVIDFGINEYIPKFEKISETATKESDLEKALFKMQLDWTEVEFILNLYRDTGTFVISGVDKIQLLLNDHLTKTQTMKNSIHIKPLEKETLEWERKLLLLQNIMDLWLKVQEKWMYMKPIFTFPDIQQQMPEEGRHFTRVDKIWKDLMSLVATNPKVMSVIEIDRMLDLLKESTTLLEVIQKGLNNYLENSNSSSLGFISS